MPFSVNGAEGQQIEIKDGEYYFNTKARVRRMMLNSLSSEARQVYACLEMATMAFQQELAVTMERGKKRPLTSDDLCQQTGLSRQNVRRGIAELEDEGLAERKPIEGGTLSKGNIEIYSWAVPRQAKCKLHCSQRKTTIPAWVPESWKPLIPVIKRLKCKLPENLVVEDDYILLEGEQAAKDYQEAEFVVIKLLERVSALARLNKEERTERTTERTTVSQSVSTVVEEETTTVEGLTDRLTEIDEAIPEELKEDLGEKPSLELLKRIDSKLQGAPTQNLTRRIYARYKDIKSLGMIVNLADDVGQAYSRAEKERKKAESIAGARAAPPPETAEYATRLLDDPESTEHDKEFARTLLAAAMTTGP